MRKELKQRLAKEFRYAATRMQQESHPAKKLFYFSVFLGRLSGYSTGSGIATWP